MVIVNFIRDKEVGIYARAKRLAKQSPVPIKHSKEEKKKSGCPSSSGSEDEVGTDSSSKEE